MGAHAAGRQHLQEPKRPQTERPWQLLVGHGARLWVLLVVPRPSQEVHYTGPHEGLTKDENAGKLPLEPFFL